MPVHSLEYYINRSWLAALQLGALALVLGAFAYMQDRIAYATGAGGAGWLIAGITPLLLGLMMPLFAYAAGAIINQAMPSADDMRHQAVWVAFGQAMGATLTLLGAFRAGAVGAVKDGVSSADHPHAQLSHFYPDALWPSSIYKRVFQGILQPACRYER